MKPKKPEQTPPHLYEIWDPDPRIGTFYYVFSYVPLETNAVVWSKVAQFLGGRKRRMPLNWLNLPKAVKLVVRQDGKVIPIDLPTQRELEAGQKIQNRRTRQIESYLRKLQKKTKMRHPDKPKKEV